MGFLDDIRQLFATAPPPTERSTGRPTSSNGASSHHLFWKVAVSQPIVEVRATLEVRRPPTVPRLYFWAMQASFSDGARPLGGAHLGLQHHPKYPDACAANWGGYHDRSQGGGELEGTPSKFPSAVGNLNTCNFAWQPNRPYTLRIARGERGWSGSIGDPSTGEHVLRELFCGGTVLRSPSVWTESFAECDAPPAEVRWSDCGVVTTDGRFHEVTAVSTNYQSVSDGGCSTSNSTIDAAAFVQETGVARTVPTGSTLQLGH